ncbi:hypothetical protein IQ07DRAFT_96318 [Pyrenochaeta sp. DS3sAY3a]|nr:hypothetical protein IQ07DRAFT_96318 [Pyrenochaeta sp. DS3sAY3a]
MHAGCDGGVGRVWLRMTRDEDLATRQRLLWPERVSATPGEKLQRAPPSSAYSGQGKERKERRTGKTGDKEEWQRSGWYFAERAEMRSRAHASWTNPRHSWDQTSHQQASIIQLACSRRECMSKAQSQSSPALRIVSRKTPLTTARPRRAVCVRDWINTCTGRRRRPHTRRDW